MGNRGFHVLVHGYGPSGPNPAVLQESDFRADPCRHYDEITFQFFPGVKDQGPRIPVSIQTCSRGLGRQPEPAAMGFKELLVFGCGQAIQLKRKDTVCHLHDHRAYPLF